MILVLYIPPEANDIADVVAAFGKQFLMRIHHAKHAAANHRCSMIQAIAYAQGKRGEPRRDVIITTRKVYAMAEARQLLAKWYGENA